MKRDINLYEMIELVHVPGVNRTLAAKLDEWEKQGLASCEVEYERRRQEYYKNLFVAPKRLLEAENKSTSPARAQLYWIELLQYEEWQWRIEHMEPWPGAFNHQYKVLPRDILERISESLVDPDRVVTMKGVRSNVLKKTIDLQFVRYSKTHIFGTVKEYQPEQVNWEGDLEIAFQTFFNYKNKFPRAVSSFVEEFLADLTPGMLKMLGYQSNPAEAGGTGKITLRVQEMIAKLQKMLVRPARGEEWWPTSVGNDVDLYRLIRLARLPEFYEMLKWELRQLKEVSLSIEVKLYEIFRDYYFIILPRQLGRRWGEEFKGCKREYDDGSPQPYWFELTRFAPDEWEVTFLNPWPPVYENHTELLPLDDFPSPILTSTEVDPYEVHKSETAIMGLLGKKLDLCWVRYSSNCVFGAVRENYDDPDKFITGDNGSLGYKGYIEAAKHYQQLFRYLRLCPDLAKTFITQFMEVMLPILNKNQE